MKCYARVVASAGLLSICLLAWTSRSLADTDSPWALGAQVVSATTHFGDGIDTIGPGIRGSVLGQVAPALWVGAEMAACAWVQPAVSYSTDERPHPLARRFQAGSASLVLHTGPRWRYRPYWVAALSLDQETGSATPGAGPKQMERVPGWAIGLGTRGSHGPLPWFEWRWHQSFGSMAILGGRRLVYQTWGIGLGWN